MCFLFFLLLLFGALSGVIFKRVLKSIFSIISAAGFRKKKNNTKKLTSGLSIELKFDTDGNLINLGFPRYKTHYKLDVRGKRQGFDGKKPN